MYLGLYLALLPFKLLSKHFQLVLVEFLPGERVCEVSVVLSEFDEFSLNSLYSFAELVVLELEIGVLFIDFSVQIVSGLHLPLIII